MYSQCPKCQAIFSVSESDIGAHRGLVRCGYCSSIFHAVTNQVDDAHVPSGREAPADTSSEPSDQQFDAGGAPPSGAGDVHVPAGDEAPGVSGGAEPIEEQQGAAAGTPPSGADEDHAPAGNETPEVIGGAESVPDEQADEASLDAGDEAGDEAGTTGMAVNDDRGPGEYEPGLYPEAAEDREDPAPGPEVGDQSDEQWIEAALSETDVADDQGTHDPGALPGEITEEITIEAPPVLWNVFDEELDADAEDDASISREPARENDAGPGIAAAGPPEPGSRPSEPERARRAARAPRPAESDPGAAGRAPGRRTPLSSYRARDVRMVELPQPRPFKTATLSLTVVLLSLLLVWQAKTYYLEELAQLPVLRPYLELLCRPLGCVLPPRRDFAQIDLVGTSIGVNTEIPGALEITVSLINRAGFAQPYPPLRVTLSDREGRVVGRRTYRPSEYRQGEAEQTELLPAQEVRDVSIKLAQPAENAVGYEVELITPIDSDD